MGKKRIRRHSKSAAVYLPIASLLILLLMAFGVSVFLEILVIEVVGASTYTDDDIIKASGIAMGNNMLFVDKDKASLGIYSLMPYINEVVIEFKLPDRVRIIVNESLALAVIEDIDGAWMIDSEGRILERVETAAGGLFEVIGFVPVEAAAGSSLRAAPADEAKLRHLKEVLAAIDKAGVQDNILYLDITNIGNISLGYTEGFTVLLGGSSGAQNKLTKLPEAIDSVKMDESFDANSRYKIDMSDSSGRWLWTPER